MAAACVRFRDICNVSGSLSQKHKHKGNDFQQFVNSEYIKNFKNFQITADSRYIYLGLFIIMLYIIVFNDLFGIDLIRYKSASCIIIAVIRKK